MLTLHPLEGGNNQENSTSVTMLGNYGDRVPQEVKKNGFISQNGGEPEELIVVKEDEEGEWVEEANEYVLVDYTKIGELIQVFKT